MTKPTKWHVRPVKTQISLGIRSVWSESSPCTQWVAKDPSFLHADSEDSDHTGWMPRQIWVFAGRTVILLVLSWGSSFVASSMKAHNKTHATTCMHQSFCWPCSQMRQGIEGQARHKYHVFISAPSQQHWSAQHLIPCALFIFTCQYCIACNQAESANYGMDKKKIKKICVLGFPTLPRFLPDPKHFIVNCEQNVVSVGKWGKIYWKMQFLYKIPSFFQRWNLKHTFSFLA